MDKRHQYEDKLPDRAYSRFDKHEYRQEHFQEPKDYEYSRRNRDDREHAPKEDLRRKEEPKEEAHHRRDFRYEKKGPEDAD